MKPNEGFSAPRVHLAAEQVTGLERGVFRQPQGGHVEEHHSFAFGERIEGEDDDDRLVSPLGVEAGGQVLGEGEDRLVRGMLHREVTQLVQGRVLAADRVQPGEQIGDPDLVCPCQSRGRYSYFSLSICSSAPGRATDSANSYPE